MKKVMFLFTLISLSSVNAASSPVSGPTDAWFECKADSECVSVHFTCTGAIVNKSFEKDAHKYYGYQNSVMNCIEKVPTKEMLKVPFKIFCEKNKCKQQGINPKTKSFI